MKYLALCLLLAAASVASAAPFDIKGIALGQKTDEQAIRAALGFGCQANHQCAGTTTLGGRNVDMNIKLTSEMVVDEITVSFLRVYYDDIKSGLKAKFGPPVLDGPAKMPGQYGPTIVQAFTWKNESGDDVEMMDRLDPTHGVLILSSGASNAAEAAESNKRKTDF